MPIWIDKQPFPIHGHDFDVDGFDPGIDGFIRVQAKSEVPDQGSENCNDDRGNQPDDPFDLSGAAPFWHIGRFGVGRTVFAGKQEDHDRNGNNDNQHERDSHNDDEPLGISDRSFGIEKEHVAAASEKKCGT
jgi:hypothetical protein